MASTFDSVCLVAVAPIGEDAASSSSSNFGTGFCVHRDERDTYVVTCAHVVENAYPTTQYQATVDGKLAIIEAYDRVADIAVLRVESAKEYALLQFSDSATEGQKIQIVGMPPLTKYREKREFLALDGVLAKKSGWSRAGEERIPTWYLKLDEPDFKLREGYSGSPVIDRATERVIGIVSLQVKDGYMGIAVAVSVLKQVWRNCPLFLPKQPSIMSPKEESFREEPFKVFSLKSKKKREEASHETLSKKLDCLRESRDTTNDDAKKFDLSAQIEKLENDLEVIANKIQELEELIISI